MPTTPCTCSGPTGAIVAGAGSGADESRQAATPISSVQKAATLLRKSDRSERPARSYLILLTVVATLVSMGMPELPPPDPMVIDRF